MKITEPVTMLTDYALATVAIVLGLCLQEPGWESTPVTLWAVGFYATAAAALAGGTFHGFANWFSRNTLESLWNVTVFLIGLSGGLMVAGAVAASIGWSDEATDWLLAGLAFAALGFGVQQSGWRRHRHLNHNDISHLIQIGALALFYLGASRIPAIN